MLYLLKSTVLPGTARLIKTDKLTSKKIYICSNPSFLEGKSWIDFNQADKIVIGSDDLKLINFKDYIKNLRVRKFLLILLQQNLSNNFQMQYYRV